MVSIARYCCILKGAFCDFISKRLSSRFMALATDTHDRVLAAIVALAAVRAGDNQYTAMTQSIIVFDQLVVAWIVKTVAVY
jgi:hydrogenase-4 membrane subunit HyfE